jgi:hypothetical protein
VGSRFPHYPDGFSTFYLLISTCVIYPPWNYFNLNVFCFLSVLCLTMLNSQFYRLRNGNWDTPIRFLLYILSSQPSGLSSVCSLLLSHFFPFSDLMYQAGSIVTANSKPSRKCQIHFSSSLSLISFPTFPSVPLYFYLVLYTEVLNQKQSFYAQFCNKIK